MGVMHRHLTRPSLSHHARCTYKQRYLLLLSRHSSTTPPRNGYRRLVEPIGSTLSGIATPARSFWYRWTGPPLAKPGPVQTFIHWSLIIATGLSLASGYWFNIWHITGSSMSPTFCPTFRETGQGEYVLFKRIPPHDATRRPEAYKGQRYEDVWPDTTSSYARGMVVAFHSPRHPGAKPAVKRVIGVAGDIVVPLRGDWAGEPHTVPYGHLWVEGDNKADSLDSNDYGPISGSLVQGVATRVLSFDSSRRRTYKTWEDEGHNGWWKAVQSRVQRKGQVGQGEVPAEHEMFGGSGLPLNQPGEQLDRPKIAASQLPSR